MRVFTRIVESRSFIQVATDLNLPRSTVSDAIQTLESRLGVSLLHRTTRVVKPTLDGDVYYHRCLAILADIEDAESAFAGGAARGKLRVDVHGILARHFLLPTLPQFLALHPELEIHIGEGDRLVDLVREGVDCALRVGIPAESDLIARSLGEIAEVTCASPDYLNRYGTPVTLDDLGGHCMVGFRSTATDAILPLEFMDGDVQRNVMLPTKITVNGAETLRHCALQGLGIIQKPRYSVVSDLESGLLVELLPDRPPSPSPVSVLYPRDRHQSPRVRAFIDWAVDAFKSSVIQW